MRTTSRGVDLKRNDRPNPIAIGGTLLMPPPIRSTHSSVAGGDLEDAKEPKAKQATSPKMLQLKNQCLLPNRASLRLAVLFLWTGLRSGSCARRAVTCLNTAQSESSIRSLKYASDRRLRPT